MTMNLASQAVLVFATLPIGSWNAQEEGSETNLIFRIASSEPVKEFVEHRLPGNGGALFVSETDIIDGSHVERVSFFRDHQGHRAIGLTFTDEGARKMAKATSDNAPTVEFDSHQSGVPRIRGSSNWLCC